jgi:hypothetical protein
MSSFCILHYTISAAATATISPRYVADGCNSAAASDLALPQHSRSYVTLFACAATSNTDPFVEPWL